MQVRLEFTTEPFHGEDERLPAHVTAAANALSYAGLSPDLGPLGTSVAGQSGEVIPALARAVQAALDNGATRITLQLEHLEEVDELEPDELEPDELEPDE